MRLRFGRYRGMHLADVPAPYLRWVARQPRTRVELREAIAATLGSPRRTGATQAIPIARVDYKSRQAGSDA